MHSAIELRNLSVKPKINNIFLKILSEYYEMFLYPFPIVTYIIYVYFYLIPELIEKPMAVEYDIKCHLDGDEVSTEREDCMQKNTQPIVEFDNSTYSSCTRTDKNCKV